jgi:predicted NBD/HSP70 family sugar kinase
VSNLLNNEDPSNFRETLCICKNTIEVIRHYNISDKSDISNKSGLSWPTVNTHIAKLSECKIIEDAATKKDTAMPYALNRNIAFFAGIAVGCKQIKFLIIDFKFECVSFNDLLGKKNISDRTKNIYDNKLKNHRYPNNSNDPDNKYLYFISPDKLSEIAVIVNNILGFIKSLYEDGIPICGIGFSVPGAVNQERRTIVGALNKPCLNNLKVDDLFYMDKFEYFSKKGIPITIDHNSKLTAVAEKEYLYLLENPNKGKGNIAVVYMGSSIAVGLILNHQLYRGALNFSGEIGHICAPKMQDRTEDKVPCVCGKNYCLESRFKQYGLHDVINGIKEINEESQEDFNETFSFYIGFMIELISQLFNPDLIIFSGKIATLDLPIWPYANILKRDVALPYIAEATQVMRTAIDAPHSAIGAAINSYYVFIRNERKNDIGNPTIIDWVSVDEK